MESPYDVLGVDADADEETVVRAYRRRVKETHPDRGGSVEAFRRVREAYELIVTGEAPPPGEAVGDGPPGSGGDHRNESRSGSANEPGVGAPGAGAGQDVSAGADADRGDAPERAEVEYLDYEAMDDHGWTLADEDVFGRAASAGLDAEDYGRFLADTDETLLQAAESQGHRWPFACRGGACANCAIYLAEGSVETTVDHVLSTEMVDAGFRLSCICRPASERLRIVYNVKHLPGLEEFRLPATRFERARSDG